MSRSQLYRIFIPSFVLVFMGMSWGLSTQIAHASVDGGWVSGGGDPLRFYFEEGRELALNILTNFDASLLPEKTSDDVKGWILVHLQDMQNEVSVSPFDWTVEDQATCGLTQFSLGATISFSTESCRSIGSSSEATKMIFHECTHHLGVRIENFSDQVALALAAAWENQKLKKVPSCKVGQWESFAKDLLGAWNLDLHLTRRLGNPVGQQARGEISFTDQIQNLSKFEGFGQCAVKAGVMTITRQQHTRSMPYALVVWENSIHLVTMTEGTGPRPGPMPRPNPSRGPRVLLPGIRQGQTEWDVDLIHGKSNDLDLMLISELGSEEVFSAFARKP